MSVFGRIRTSPAQVEAGGQPAHTVTTTALHSASSPGGKGRVIALKHVSVWPVFECLCRDDMREGARGLFGAAGTFDSPSHIFS